jgi:hypothetical protein
MHEHLLDALIQLGAPHNVPQWSPDNPTAGNSYVVTEICHHFSAFRTDVYCMAIGPRSAHWFLKHYGEVIDYCASQYRRQLDYTLSVPRPLFVGNWPTRKGWISGNGVRLAHLLGLPVTID